MRDLNELNKYRVYSPMHASMGDGTCGAFIFKSCTDAGELRILASSGAGWDHVSVSRRNRCPNWHEMEQAKRIFFKADETAMQLHVPPDKHINCHPYTLHIWRPHGATIPMPPDFMV